jgi:hypothetical protein
MTIDRIEALRALLAETERAHGVYETRELNGVYDEAWPHWYAAYAVDHGISEHVGRAVTVEEVEEVLTRSWGELERTDPKPPWATYTAGRILAEL